MTDDRATAKRMIREYAEGLGFDAVGFAAATAAPADAAHLTAYIAEGRHGDMTWMADTAGRRADPRALWPEARTIIALGINYGPAGDPLAAAGDPDRAAISAYAQGRDYHLVLKSRLKALGRWLVAQFGGAAKAFVDTAPVMEKPVAMRAGLGWIGKHTNLVSRRFGSWLFLGEVFTTLELPPDPPAVDHCGSCDRCRAACPTGALPEPYRIDPRRCLSYLTIEHRGEIDPGLEESFGNRVYGCDDCLAVCPWNRFASPTRHAALAPQAGRDQLRLVDLALADDPGFRALFTASPVKRTGRDRVLRNVAIAAGNAGTEEAANVLRRLRADPARSVRDAARRATARQRNREGG